MNNINVWVPLLSSVVGGLLVWMGQLMERKSRSSRENRSSLLAIYAFCRRLEAAMKNQYRELAMTKTHVEYWWYCANSSSSDQNMKQNYYKDHLRCQGEAREIERRIGDTKADFIAHVRKFQIMKEIPQNIETRLEAIADLTHQKAKQYDSQISHNKVRDELVEQDESDLRERYYASLEDFRIINDTLQGLIKS